MATYLEDYAEGETYEFGRYAFTEQNIIAFAREFDPQAFHVDPQAAAAGPFGGLVASGFHTLSAMMRLLVDHFISPEASLGSPGMGEIRWLAPVRPGDVLGARLTVTERRLSRSRPDRGALVQFIEMVNQDGTVVMTAVGTGFYRRRPREDWSPMLAYDPPLADYAFLLHQVLAVETRRDLPGYGDLSPDFTAAVLGEAGRLVVNELLPLNLSGDAEGCTFADGAVRTPRGFKEAYGKLVDGGWIGLSGSAEYGGQGLPGILSAAVSEFLVSANMGFSGYVDLTQAAARTLWVHGTADQKARYLGPLTTGAWGGAMALTEPQAGTDLGLLRCRAEAAGDGTYRITGSKLFITAADHDLTDNIVVLTLARLPGGPPGTRGLSLFLVPRFPVAADGTLGPRNAMTTVSLEHKMGVRASATCALAFEGAVGELIGGEHEGLARMFTMMNDTRLGVGMQGLAIAEVAYQNALAYARDRRQGRAPGDHAPAAGGADPIVRHPDVRRMLLRIKSFTGAARALALWTAVQIDTADGHPDPAARREAEDLVALMTPVIKAHFTDMGSAAANLALQCYGGHGYIREWGVEQLVRDVRITQIYEGTNGVQALDLVGRKLRQDNERAPRLFLARVADTCAAAGAGPARELVTDLAAMADTLGRATDWIVAQDRVRAAAAATDYLGLFARVALAWSWVRIVMAAGTAAAAGTLDAARAGDRARTAAHYLALARPEAEMLAARCRRCVDLPDLADFRVDGDAA